MMDFAKDLLLSSCAAAFEGPKTRSPAASNSSTIPAPIGSSGPTIGQIDFVFLRECDERGEIVLRDIHRFGELIDSGIAGRAEEPPYRLARMKPPAERVLARTLSDDEDFHRILMTEVTHAGEDHREAVLVRRRDDLVVAHRAARLRDRRRARLGRQRGAVGERKQRLGHQHRTLK